MKSSAPATAELLEVCQEWIHRYVVLSAEQSVVIATWVLHTYAIEAAESTPYLHITAPEKGCGKSRLLETLEPIVYKPCKTGGMTAAALVRTMDEETPTLLLDEFDAAIRADKEYSQALRGILNEGFRRGGNFRKVEGKDHKLRVFQVFGAKAIAGIGKIPDTVASRSIVIEMRRKISTERVEPFRQREVREGARPLKVLLEAWRSNDRLRHLRDARPETPNELTDRQKDMSEPLLAIGDLAGGEWPERLRRALMVLLGSAASEDDSKGAMLLRDIRSIFEELEGNGPKLKGIHSVQLAEALCKREGPPWADCAGGRGLDANRLAKLLKPFRISPLSIRLEGANQKGYRREDFEDAWLRYCSQSAVTPILAVTPVTNRITTGQNTDFIFLTQLSAMQAAVTLQQASVLHCDAVTAPVSQENNREQEVGMLEGEL
jgi:hypothetical protein